MAQALGVKFSDADGKELRHGGGALSELESIDVSGLDARLDDCEVIVAADVSNSLTGDDGATRVYAPQKGASQDEVERLEKNLKHYAAVIRQQLNKDIDEVPGSGAAGGLGAGLMVFAGATIQKGFDVVNQTVDLESKISDVDLVITGEGKIDRQTQFGKTPYGVAALAKKYQKPVVAFAGTLGEKHQELYQHGFDVIFPITDKPMTLKESVKNAGNLLRDAAERMARMMKSGKLSEV
jgi:glycerate 2-kinase